MASTSPTTNELLGYPDDARLLIINADDLGMSHAGNEATFQSLTTGIATSTTLMTPCPWAPHAMQFLRNHPKIPFGVHLTIICEFDVYRWGPATSRNSVPSLIDETGCFYRYSQLPGLFESFRLEEVAVEFRAQIDAVLAAGLRPTHLDWHCIADGGRPDIFELTLELAQEYGLALRVHDLVQTSRLLSTGLPAADHGLMNSYEVDPSTKHEQYVELLRELPAGLSEWAVHPGLGNEESRTLEPESWQVRRTDLDFLVSPEARATIEQEGIILLDFRPLQQRWTEQRTTGA